MSNLLDQLLLASIILLLSSVGLTLLAKFFWWASKVDEYMTRTWSILRIATLFVAIILIAISGGMELMIYYMFF